jgi:signal transduction histidine kinase
MTRIRNLLATIAILWAFALLGGLVLISTRSGDDASRRLDLALRQTGELVSRLTSTASAAARGETSDDAATMIAELRTALDQRLSIANSAFETLYPQNPSPVQQARTLAVEGFDSIDVRTASRPDAASLRSEFAAVNANAAVFDRRAEALGDALERWERTRRFIDVESRRLIGDLRSGRDNAAADLIFRSVEQLRTRLEQGLAFGPAEAGELVDSMVAGVELGDAELAGSFEQLAAAMRELAPARLALTRAEEDLLESPLPQLLSGLREQVGTDLVHRLSTLGDARVLLNVYTALLLAVLIHFGLRLRGSYAALNRSHDDLELRVADRTRDLEQANHDLKESQVQLVQAEKMSSLGQLVAGVAHEINTPLMYVQSNVTTTSESVAEVADVLAPALQLARDLREPKPDMALVKQRLAEIRERVDPEDVEITVDEVRQLNEDSVDGLVQIAELVQSLKDFSRLDRSDRDRFDVREGLEKTLTITRNLHKYGIEVVRDFEEVPAVSCAPSRINQVFINLVTNAIQSMDGQGRLELATRDGGDDVQISISDTGCGIPEEHLAKVMDPFFTTKPVGEGTGLGLSIVRQIIDEHGGRLEIASVPDTGTTITVFLPVEQDVQEEAA